MSARALSHAASRFAPTLRRGASTTTRSLSGNPSRTAPAAVVAATGDRTLRPSLLQVRRGTNGSYAAEKAAAKQKRRETWHRKQARQEGLKTRRDGRPRDERKNEFREWFDRVRMNQERLDRKARQADLPWRVRVSAVVERLPVVTPDRDAWEDDYIDLKTYLLAFGKEYPKELGFMRDVDETDRPDLTEEDLLAMLPEGFKPAPRETEADSSGEVKTLDRKLKGRVYLTVKGSERAEGGVDGGAAWTFPASEAKEDETLLDAAKRATSDAVGKKLELYCPSNCPMAVHMRAYSEDEKKDDANAGYFGEKTFFFRVQLDDGDVSPKAMKVEDYAWLDREEVFQRVTEQRGENVSKLYHYLL